MKHLKRLFRKDKGTWTLAVITLMVAGISLWTSNFLYRSRNVAITPNVPESNPEAATRCSLSFSLTPPCEENVHIVGMSIDRSSSMTRVVDGKQKLTYAKEAAATLVSTLKASGKTNVSLSLNSFGAQSPTGGRLGSAFNSTLHTSLTSNYDSVLNAINSIRYREEGTCIECGIKMANSQVNTGSNAKRVAILISDGMANRRWDGSSGSAEGKQAAITAANNGRNFLGMEYHVIGYGEGTNIDQNTLRSIAGSNGSYQYKPNPNDWSAAMMQILNNICSGGGTTPTRRPGTPTPTRRVTPTPTRSVTGTRVPTPTQTTTGRQILITEDAYVSSSASSSNFGNATNLYTNANPLKETYLKLNLTSVTTNVASANLRLYVTNRTTGTIDVKSIPGTWGETTITYSNRPLGSNIASFTTPSTGTWTNINLTQLVNANKGRTVTVSLVSRVPNDDVIFSSSEAGSNKPYLQIQ